MVTTYYLNWMKNEFAAKKLFKIISIMTGLTDKEIEYVCFPREREREKESAETRANRILFRSICPLGDHRSIRRKRNCHDRMTMERVLCSCYALPRQLRSPLLRTLLISLSFSVAAILDCLLQCKQSLQFFIFRSVPATFFPDQQ